MRTHTVLAATILLSAGAALMVGLAPIDAGAHTERTVSAPTWVADVTRDGVVDLRDVAFVVRRVGQRCSAKRREVAGDVNRDCRVDGRDVAYVLWQVHTVRRAPVNQPPQPRADVASTNEDTPVTIAVLANDVDPDGEVLRVVSVGAGRMGTTAVGADGRVRYVPAANAHGTDTFSYKVTDTRGLTASQSVTVTVVSVNDSPAVSIAASVQSGPAPLEVNFSATGRDVDGDPLTFAWTFGDGGAGQGPQAVHTYARAGEFVATVVVSDGVLSAEASLGIPVSQPPAARPSDYVVDTVAGTGVAGPGGEGGPATAARLSDPRQVAVAPDGSFYLADARRIVRVDATGTLSTVRTLAAAEAGDEGPSLAVGPEGTVYYTDADATGYCGEWGQYVEVRVRRLTSSATEDPVVATWVNQDSLGTCSPSLKLAVDGAGSFYLGVAESVVKVLPDATGAAAWVQGLVDLVYSLAGDPAGGVVVGGFSSVARIDAEGTVTALAGNGVHGFSGDGGPALAASVGTVGGLTVCPDGTVTLLDFDQASGVPRVREVTPDGRIATIGGGRSGFNGDGQPALSTAFGFALSAGVAALPDGGFYVADRDNLRVRRLRPTLVLSAPMMLEP